MKIVAGVALMAGAVVADVLTLGATTAFFPEIIALEIGAFGAGAELTISGIGAALHLNNTGQTAVGSHAPFRPWQIVYGRQRVTGDTIDMSISDGGNGDNRWLWEVDVLAAHPVQNIRSTYLNQQRAFLRAGTNGLTGNLQGSSITDNGNMDIPGMVLEIHPFDLSFREYSNFYFDGNPRFWQALYDGTQTVADPFYVANCAQTLGSSGTLPHWDSTCIVQNMAYAINRYWSNANWAAGKPNVRYDVQGKNNIYDPRLDTAPGANPTDPAYQAYTENAALVIADYMTNQQYGMMYSYADFDMDTLVAAANICDETVTLTNSQLIWQVTYTTEARYAINGVMSTSTDGGTVIQQMLGACAGRISYVGGKWFIFPGAFQGVAGPSLTEGDLAGPISWNPLRKSRDLFNEVRATFVCPSGWDTTSAPGFDVYNVIAQTVEDTFNGQWARVDIPPMCFNALRGYASDPYLTQDNDVKYIHNSSYPYTISVATAQRLAKIELLRNRWQGTGKLKLPIAYLGVMPNDILTITYPRFGWTNKQLEVQSTHIDLGSPGQHGEISAPTITVSVAEVDASIYTWLATDELELMGGQSIAGASALMVQPPTGVVLTSGEAYAQTTAQAGVFNPGLNVAWAAPLDASVTSGGKIYIQVAPAGSTSFQTVAMVDGSTTQYLITGLNNNTAYQVQLYCENSNGIYSVPTAPVSATTSTGIPAIPPAPTGLSAASVEVVTAAGLYVSQVRLAWTSSTDLAVTANGFIQVWCQPSGGANVLVASLPGSAAQYFYNGADAGSTYAFSLVAVDVWGNQSAACAQVSLTVSNSVAWSASAPPLPYGLMSNEIRTSIAITTGYVENLGGVAAASITPIAGLMPAQVGADVTAKNTALNTANVGNQTAATVAGGATAVLLQNANFAAGGVGWWGSTDAFSIVPATGTGPGYTAALALTNTDDTSSYTKPVCILPNCNPGGVNAPASCSYVIAPVTSPPATSPADADMVTMSVTTLATSTQTNVLYTNVYGQNDNVTQIIREWWFRVGSVMGSSYEFDMQVFDQTRSLVHCFGLQVLANGQWQIGNFQDPWENVPASVPVTALVAGQWYHCIYTGHRVIGDTSGPGGVPNNYYDSLEIDGTVYPLNMIMESAPLPAGWSGILSDQNQVDVGPTSGTAETVTCDYTGNNITFYTGSPSNGPTGYTGSKYIGQFQSSLASSGYFQNEQDIPCIAGAVLSATAQIEGSSGANGDICVVINWFTAAGAYLSAANGNYAAPGVGWVQSRVVATGPPGTGFATVSCNVLSGCTSGYWNIGAVTAAIQPNSVDEVPNGTVYGKTNLGYVDSSGNVTNSEGLGGVPAGSITPIASLMPAETGADKTLNHVLTTFISANVTYPTSGLTAIPGFAWDVTANSASDVFNIAGQFMWEGISGADVQVVGIVDGSYASAFGYGFDWNTSANTAYGNVAFFGTATGLAAGAHTIALYYYSPNGSTITLGASGYSSEAQLQQISS